MASLKRKAREGGPVKHEKDVCLTDSVLELSITVGYLGADVKREEMACLDALLRDHCVAGVVALERGETESHLHFQMVVRARSRSARSFGILVRKYMGWFGRRAMSPVGKVTCKVLTNRYIHTFLGMIGYCLKDAGSEHFEHCMHNVSDEDVIAGKTLHTIYGRADSKQRVTLTNKNITDRMYVWFKYRTRRKLTASFLSTLTDMIQSGIFIPSAAWIIPLNGQGMDYKRMSCLWKCITEPRNVSKTDVQEIFVKKRNYVKGRYFDEEESGGSESFQNCEQDAVLPDSQEGSILDMKPSSPVLRSALKPVSHLNRRVLFEATEDVKPVKKSVSFDDHLGDYIGLKDNASLIVSEYLNTTNAQGLSGRRLQSRRMLEAGKKVVDGNTDGVANDKVSDLIDLTCDSDDDDTVMLEGGRKAILDRVGLM